MEIVMLTNDVMIWRFMAFPLQRRRRAETSERRIV
ncbi:unnamed protein product [Amoebophrya sp. A25]|nr:unnamed protein product [Amoebophrya sp. A25]|eukprot:GSA25T00025806001.1